MKKYKTVGIITLILLFITFTNTVSATSSPNVYIPYGESYEVQLEAPKTEDVFLIVTARIDWPTVAGAADIMRVQVNGKTIVGSQLVNKGPTFTYSDGRSYPYYEMWAPSSSWAIFYSPDFTSNDIAHSSYKVIGGNAYIYKFVVSDMVNKGKKNTISIQHTGPEYLAALHDIPTKGINEMKSTRIAVGDVSFIGEGSERYISPSWKYYKEITVRENSGKNLINYQVLVKLNLANFDFSKIKSDGSDLRFIDTNGNELNYWIEECNFGAKEAKIWVKVSNIPATGETKIKMYYGNEKASAVSDGDKVFEFFDDFENGIIDTTIKWDSGGSMATIIDNPYSSGENKVLDVSYDHYLYSKNTFFPPFAYRCSGASSSGNSPNIGVVSYENYDSTSGGTQLFWRAYSGPARPNKDKWESAIKYREPSGDWATAYTDNPTHQYRNWFVGETVVKSRSYHAHYVNDILIKEWTGAMSGSTNPGICPGGGGNQAGQYIDWVLIRKYTSSEPTITFSAEYQTTTPTPTPPTAPEGKRKAVWLYNSDKYDTSSLITSLKLAGINTIFMSTDVNNIWKYERFVKSAHEDGIEVHAMILEDPSCALQENHESSIKAVESVLDYNDKSLAKFDGINIDTEPYVALDLEQVWPDYTTLLEAMRAKTEGKTVLSADIPRWYDETKIKDLASNINFFVIMAYDSGGAGWNTASEIEDAVASEMGAIRGEGSKAVIGIALHEGFEDKGVLEKCVEDLYQYYSKDSAFLGVSIFEYDSYCKLADAPGDSIPFGEQKGIPGFEVVFAIAVLLAVGYILRRWEG